MTIVTNTGPRAVVLEKFGPADDVLVFTVDPAAGGIIRALPRYARHFDKRARVWRVNPGAAERVAAALTRQGFDVRVLDKSGVA